MDIYNIGQYYFSEEDADFLKTSNRSIDILYCLVARGFPKKKKVVQESCFMACQGIIGYHCNQLSENLAKGMQYHSLTKMIFPIGSCITMRCLIFLN